MGPGTNRSNYVDRDHHVTAKPHLLMNHCVRLYRNISTLYCVYVAWQVDCLRIKSGEILTHETAGEVEATSSFWTNIDG